MLRSCTSAMQNDSSALGVTSDGREVSILVLGAGELGMAVLRALAQRTVTVPGTAISVLLRPGGIDPDSLHKQEQAAELRSLGIRFVFSDLAQASEADLAAILRQFHTVIGCTGFVAGRSIQLKLARAALAAKVKRYLPWQFGVDYDVIGRGSAQDLFDEQLEVRAVLRSQSETEWIIISTGMFTSFLFEPSFGVVDLPRNVLHALGSWQNSVTVTTAQDIGKLTAEILFTEPRISNSVVYTAGDTITYGQLADVINLALHRKVERVLWTVEALMKELAVDPSDAIRRYRVVFAEGRGVSWPMDHTFNGQRAVPVVSVKHWLREHPEAGLSERE